MYWSHTLLFLFLFNNDSANLAAWAIGSFLAELSLNLNVNEPLTLKFVGVPLLNKPKPNNWASADDDTINLATNLYSQFDIAAGDKSNQMLVEVFSEHGSSELPSGAIVNNEYILSDASPLANDNRNYVIDALLQGDFDGFLGEIDSVAIAMAGLFTLFAPGKAISLALRGLMLPFTAAKFGIMAMLGKNKTDVNKTCVNKTTRK